MSENMPRFEDLSEEAKHMLVLVMGGAAIRERQTRRLAHVALVICFLTIGLSAATIALALGSRSYVESVRKECMR
jgi:hypothetical protein